MTRFSLTRAVVTGAVAASVALASAGAFAQNDLKIGVVSLERILRDAKVAQIASDRLNAEGRERQDEIEAMTRRFKQRLERFEKEAPSMTESERVAEPQRLRFGWDKLANPNLVNCRGVPAAPFDTAVKVD